MLMAGLSLLPGVAGYLDWAGGFIHLPGPYETFKAFIDKDLARQELTDEEDDRKQTLVHESLHFLQISSLGFMFGLAVDLFRASLPLLPTIERAGEWTPPQTISSETEANLKGLVGRLDIAGPDGITARSIIESLTYLQQKTISIGLTPEIYQKMLDHLIQPAEGDSASELRLRAGKFDVFWQLLGVFRPSEDYRIAYEVALRHLGVHTYRLFPAAAAWSLCTAQPQESFGPLCQAIARIEEQKTPAVSTGTSMDEFGWIGKACDLAERAMPHPAFTPVARQLGDKGMDAIMHNTPEEIVPLLQQVMPPLLVYDAEGRHPVLTRFDNMGAPVSDDTETTTLTMLLVTAVLDRAFTIIRQ
jgi:hypothetical protein